MGAIDECKYCCDTTKTKKIKCFRFECSNEWKGLLNFRERVNACPTHHGMIAVFGGDSPSLCDTCTSNGYYVEASGSTTSNFQSMLGFCAKYTVKKRPLSEE